MTCFIIIMTVCAVLIILPFTLPRTISSAFKSSLFLAGLCGLLAYFLLWGSMAGRAIGDSADIRQTYDTLVLYSTEMEKMSNEYVKYDFYQKVQEWNKRYEHHYDSPFHQMFPVFPDSYEGTTTIEFELNTH